MNITSIILLTINLIWHTLAAQLFTLKPRYTMERYIQEELHSDIAIDIIRFVGGLNCGYMIFALIAIFQKELYHPAVFLLFSIGNLSQFVLDLKAHKEKKVTDHFKKITIGDGVIGIANFIFCLILLIK